MTHWLILPVLLPAMLVLVGLVNAWPSRRLHHGDPSPSPNASDVPEAEDPDGARAPA